MGWEDIDIVISGHSSGGFWNGKKLTDPGHVDFVANYAFGGGPNEDGNHHIIIGTHAILNNESLLKSASLVIIDEFQKFGVEQRAKIQKHNPHLLLMSATPIPRTMAMTVFGDLDVSTIRELPIKRGTVVTRWVLPDKREAMYEIIEGELMAGHQVYVVYPRIDGGEDVASAIKGHDCLRDKYGEDSVCLLTGKNSNEAKTWAMQNFRGGTIKILVSTIIAEVGLDCPNATVMVIEGADRFGLSQLHQLRGRVCRSTDTAFCFLVAETANQTSIDRLNVIEKCNDGFEIAEHDLRLRGPGEMFSTRQHGLPDLKFASLVDDYDLLIKTRDMAAELVDKLDEPENAGLKEILRIKYGDTLELGEVR
jgi:ATP-dependent DNA helicase RecG